MEDELPEEPVRPAGMGRGGGFEEHGTLARRKVLHEFLERVGLHFGNPERNVVPPASGSADLAQSLQRADGNRIDQPGQGARIASGYLQQSPVQLESGSGLYAPRVRHVREQCTRCRRLLLLRSRPEHGRGAFDLLGERPLELQHRPEGLLQATPAYSLDDVGAFEQADSRPGRLPHRLPERGRFLTQHRSERLPLHAAAALVQQLLQERRRVGAQGRERGRVDAPQHGDIVRGCRSRRGKQIVEGDVMIPAGAEIDRGRGSSDPSDPPRAEDGVDDPVLLGEPKQLRESGPGLGDDAAGRQQPGVGQIPLQGSEHDVPVAEHLHEMSPEVLVDSEAGRAEFEEGGGAFRTVRLLQRDLEEARCPRCLAVTDQYAQGFRGFHRVERSGQHVEPKAFQAFVVALFGEISESGQENSSVLEMME
ncbi:MAG: hypothetical protein BWX47_02022 [candidate division Hyd24-12 bacterium ADurb.Bin004]|nr:MAG: hypothetical protein BWX47_02022 [candidate division Hyd24-12 bacterium ADurb.Bin004]